MNPCRRRDKSTERGTDQSARTVSGPKNKAQAEVDEIDRPRPFQHLKQHVGSEEGCPQPGG